MPKVIMITLIAGPDSFRAQAKLKEVLEQQKSQGACIDIFDFDEGSIKYPAFKAFHNNFSLFEDKKVFILKNLFSDGDLEFCDQFLNDFEFHLKSQDLIVFYDTLDIDSVSKKSGKDLFSALLNKSELYFFEQLNPALAKNWIEKKCQSLEMEIEPIAKEMLFNFFGNNLWQLENEITKLANYSKGKIIASDVKKLCRPIENLDIFKTVEAIAKREKVLAFNMIYKHLRAGESPFYIISMLADTFKKMIAIKELSEKKCDYKTIAKITGYHPFVLSKIYAQAQEFEFQDLKNIYNKIFKADFDMKTGSVEPPVALDLLVYEI